MWFLRILLICLCFVAGHHAARADNNTSIANGATTDLSLYSGCKTFLNTCGAAIMVPTAYQVTWDAIPYGFGTNQCAQQLSCYGGEPSGTNVAYYGNGGVASASGTLTPLNSASHFNDGDRYSEVGGFEITFANPETINTINVFTSQDGYASDPPTLAMTFTQYGIIDFKVQYWDGSSWRLIPGGEISNNDKVWVQFVFADITTTKIKVLIEGTANGNAPVTEVEALRSSDATNVAAAANGATISAYASFPMRPPSYAIDGSRAPERWTSASSPRTWANPNKGGLRWFANGTSSPQWVQVNFSGSEAINRIAVYLDDDSAANTLPNRRIGTYTVCLTSCVRDFKVQYWDGAAWQDIPSMTYTGNTRAVRDETFSSITTSRIRVYMTTGRASDGKFSVAEIKAFRASDGRNVALAGYGSVASASSTAFVPGNAVGNVIDGTDIRASAWARVDFNASYPINEIVVTDYQGPLSALPVNRPDIGTLSTAGYSPDYEVQYWNGTGWIPWPGGSVSGNRLVKRHFRFAPITTDKIRLVIYAINTTSTRISEIEAWTP